MELEQVGEKTFYIKNATNIGIYKIDEKSIYLIDTGNDKDAGKKILKIVEEQGWTVKGIINTHSNADHVGGNKLIQDRTNCQIYAHGIEKSITLNPVLEPSFLYGGYPFKDLKNKFLMAQPSDVNELNDICIDGIEIISLGGHFFDMIGVKTSDNVLFLADSLFSSDTINKYHIFFIYDVREFLNTLDYIERIDAKLYIPSHSDATRDISNLIDVNRKKVMEILDSVLNLCNDSTFEEILKGIFDKYQLSMNTNQYVLVGSTIKSYLSYLYDEGKISFGFVDNKMLWKKIEE